jgi:hypothetical protein
MSDADTTPNPELASPTPDTMATIGAYVLLAVITLLALVGIWAAYG